MQGRGIFPHVLMYCNEMPEEYVSRIQTYPYANFVQRLVDCVVQYGNEMLCLCSLSCCVLCSSPAEISTSIDAVYELHFNPLRFL